MRAPIFFCSLAFVTPSLIAGTDILSDSFQGLTIDSSKWQAFTPFPESKVVSGAGHVLLVSRGILLSTADFGTNLRIRGADEDAFWPRAFKYLFPQFRPTHRRE